MNTEVGKIAKIINNTEKEETPLQTKLNKVGKLLGIACIVICIIIFVVGLLYGKEPLDMFMTAVSLAVAAIPEGLAAVTTIVLAIGVSRMAKRNAIVKSLPAVETLGSTTVICTDKTGTLTQNKMTVKEVYLNGKTEKMEDLVDTKPSDEMKKFLHIAMLCNDTKVEANGTLSGDPTETALIDMGFKLMFDSSKYTTYPRMDEIPFDSDRKLMTTIHNYNNKFYCDTKGGVDEILSVCDSYLENGEVKKIDKAFLEKIDQINDDMGERALRVLAFAFKRLNKLPSKDELKTMEKGLTFVGMVRND